jgi:hypothetical protein
MMDIVREFFQIVFDCVGTFFSKGISLLDMDALAHKLAIFLGIVLASVLISLITYKFSALCNKKVTDIPAYRWLAGLSFAFALFFAISFFSLGYLHEVAIKRTDQWTKDLKGDKDWGHKTFSKVYYKLKMQGVDLTDYPPPEAGGYKIPGFPESSLRMTAKTYVEEGLVHFKASHPYLGLILKTNLNILETNTYKDNIRFSKENPGKEYILYNAIKLAADELKAGFDLRIPLLIKTTRIYLVISFLAVMASIYMAIGVIAYRDIKTFP